MKVYGILLSLVLNDITLKGLRRALLQADKDSIKIINSTMAQLNSHGPDWMGKILYRKEFNFHVCEKEVILGHTEEEFDGELPKGFQQLAQWHNL